MDTGTAQTQEKLHLMCKLLVEMKSLEDQIKVLEMFPCTMSELNKMTPPTMIDNGPFRTEDDIDHWFEQMANTLVSLDQTAYFIAKSVCLNTNATPEQLNVANQTLGDDIGLLDGEKPDEEVEGLDYFEKAQVSAQSFITLFKWVTLSSTDNSEWNMQYTDLEEGVLVLHVHGKLVDDWCSEHLTFVNNDFVDSLVLMGWPGSILLCNSCQCFGECTTKTLDFMPSYVVSERGEPFLDRDLTVEGFTLNGTYTACESKVNCLVSDLPSQLKNILPINVNTVDIRQIYVPSCAIGRKLPRVPQEEVNAFMKFLILGFGVRAQGHNKVNNAQKVDKQCTGTRDEEKRANINFLKNLLDGHKKKSKMIQALNNKFFTQMVKFYNVEKIFEKTWTDYVREELGTLGGCSDRSGAIGGVLLTLLCSVLASYLHIRQ